MLAVVGIQGTAEDPGVIDLLRIQYHFEPMVTITEHVVYHGGYVEAQIEGGLTGLRHMDLPGGVGHRKIVPAQRLVPAAFHAPDIEVICRTVVRVDQIPVDRLRVGKKVKHSRLHGSPGRYGGHVELEEGPAINGKAIDRPGFSK